MTRIWLAAVLIVFSAGFGLSEADAGSSEQPPSLLGVWYGTYEVSVDGETRAAQMWLGIYWQLSKDGWNVSGHSRWNVLDQDGEQAQAQDSMGRYAEHFDTVSGTIEKDLTTIQFKQDTQGYRMSAELTGADRMHGRVHAPGAEDSLFSVTLNRIKTGYQPGRATVKGVDVSHHSGSVDWNQVKGQGFQFAYVKSSEGVDNPDPRFREHWQGLADAGLARGAYHFYVTEDDPVEQARFFASRIKDDPGDLPPAVDVELLGHATDTTTMTATLLTFLDTLQQETGKRPVIYTDAKFWDQYFEPAFSDYHLWMAEYGVKMPKVPFGWDNWLMWQHAADRQVAGVEKNADINLLHPSVSLDTLVAAPGGGG